MVSSPPLPQTQLNFILGLDAVNVELRELRLNAGLISGNVDLLLQELNAFNQLDEKALEQVDAEIALRAAKNLAQNLNEAEDPYVLNSQRQRLLDRCRFQAEVKQKLLQRRVDEGRLSAQPTWLVYGAALGASCLSTAVMHPVDTVKVRKQALSSAAAAGAVVAEAFETTTWAAESAVAGTAAVAGMVAAEAQMVAAVAASNAFEPFDDVDAGDDGDDGSGATGGLRAPEPAPALVGAGRASHK